MSAAGDADGDQDPHPTDPTDSDIGHDDQRHRREDGHTCTPLHVSRNKHQAEAAQTRDSSKKNAETQRYTIPKTERQICGNNISR